MMTAINDKIKAAKDHVANQIIDIISKNHDDSGAALDTTGTFTALLEAYKASRSQRSIQPAIRWKR